MKDHHLINYNIFVARTKFNLKNYLKLNANISYDEFAEIMRLRKVCPPTQEMFNKIKDEVQLEIKPTEVKSQVEIISKLPKEDKPKKRTRRSRKKKTDINE